MRAILFFLLLAMLFLPRQASAQERVDSSTYCPGCLVPFPVIVYTQGIRLPVFYISKAAGDTTLEWLDKPFTIDYRYNASTRTVGMVGCSADSSLRVSGNFVVATYGMENPEQREDPDNPGTFVYVRTCCYLQGLPDGKWQMEYRENGSVSRSLSAWDHGVQHGHFEETSDTVKLLDGNYVHGKQVGSWISPGDDGLFIDRYDSTGHAYYSAHTYGYGNSLWYEEFPVRDSVSVLFPGAKEPVKAQRTFRKIYYPGGQLQSTEVVYRRQQDFFIDSITGWYESGALKEKTVYKGDRYEVRTYYENGKPKSLEYGTCWDFRNMCTGPVGVQQFWHENGNLQETRLYGKPGMIMQRKRYDENGHFLGVTPY